MPACGRHPFLPQGLSRLSPPQQFPCHAPSLTMLFQSIHLPGSHSLFSATPPNSVVPPNPPCCNSNPNFSSLKPETDLFKPSHRWRCEPQTMPGAFYVEHFHHRSSESFHLSVIFRKEEPKTTCGTSWRGRSHRVFCQPPPHPLKISPMPLPNLQGSSHLLHHSLRLCFGVTPESGPQTLKGCGIPCLVSWWNFSLLLSSPRLVSSFSSEVMSSRNPLS